MVDVRSITRRQQAFTLPTVVIVSVVMLALLATAMQLVSTTSRSLQDQYYQSLAREAAEAGLVMAEDCGSGWTQPLRPGGTCSGLASQGSGAANYLISADGVRTTFAVPTPDATGTVTSTGTVELLRSSGGTVWKSYTQNMKQQQSASRNIIWKQVSASDRHTCAIDSTGQAYCWGAGGRLGDGTSTQQLTPVAVSAPAGVTFASISSGTGHTCAISSTGQAYCWGLGTNGRLGDGATLQRLEPVAVAAPAGVTFTSISAGANHTCAISSRSEAYCWGLGTSGRLGNGTTTQQSTPVAVAAPTGVTFTSISAGSSHTCAISSRSEAYCWGLGTSGKLGDGTTTQRSTPTAVETPGGVVSDSVSLNNMHTCAISGGGQVYCWGYNYYGQLGNGDIVGQSSPVQIGAVSDDSVRPLLNFDISAGSTHTCALGSDRQGYCWGYGNGGRLGNGTTANQSIPTLVSMPSGVTFSSISAGNTHTCALGSDRQGYCWGSGNNGQLGNGTTTTQQTTPTLVAMPAGVTVVSISAGGNHTCAIGSDYQAYCWGLGSSGQLGGGSTNRPSPTLVSMPSGVTFSSISAGSTHTCALGSDRQGYCWGYGNGGRLGNGTTANQSIPTLVSMPSGVTFSSISAGNTHTCALGSDRQGYCWGLGNSGQLGNGTTTTQQTTPTLVAMPAGVTVVSISAGGNHTCAIGSDYQAYCWGLGNSGQLGNGTTTQQTTPTLVTMPSGVTFSSISAGNTHTCALGSDRQGYCWGYGNGGRLGNGMTSSRSAPDLVSQLPPFMGGGAPVFF